MSEQDHEEELPLRFKDIQEELKKPFDIEDIKFKPLKKSKKGDKAMATAHADTRAYQKRLNEVCPGDWSSTVVFHHACQTFDRGDAEKPRFKTFGKVFAVVSVTICGITRTSTGEEEATDLNPGTSAEAQGFKRACSAFGLGTFLYFVDLRYQPIDQYGFTDAALATMRKIVLQHTGQTAPKSAPKQSPAPQDTPEPTKEPEKPTQPPPNETQGKSKGNKPYVATRLRGKKPHAKAPGPTDKMIDFLDGVYEEKNIDMKKILVEKGVTVIADLKFEVVSQWLTYISKNTIPAAYLLVSESDADLGIDVDPLQAEDKKSKDKTPGFPKVDTKNPNWIAANGRLRATVKRVFKTDVPDAYKTYTQNRCSTSEMTADAIHALATEINEKMWTEDGTYIGPSYDD